MKKIGGVMMDSEHFNAMLKTFKKDIPNKTPLKAHKNLSHIRSSEKIHQNNTDYSRNEKM